MKTRAKRRSFRRGLRFTVHPAGSIHSPSSDVGLIILDGRTVDSMLFLFLCSVRDSILPSGKERRNKHMTDIVHSR